MGSVKKNCFDDNKFKIVDNLRMQRHIPYSIPPRRPWTLPEELFNLASYVIDDQPLPEAFKWKNVHVVKFIESLGFPQYRNTFYVNAINGRTLLLIDANALCYMNIKNFDHILIIAKAIRELYQVEKILFNRSISLPPRYPDTHYKYYRVFTGPKYDQCKRTDLWCKMRIIRERKKSLNHFEKLHEWLKHIPDYQRERVGYAPRFRLYYVKKKPAEKPPPLEIVPCTCSSPCECEWTERDLRAPWKLEYLLKHGADGPDVQPGDILIAAADSKTDNKCECIPPCECRWTVRDFHKPWIFTVLRRKLKEDAEAHSPAKKRKLLNFKNRTTGKSETSVKFIKMPCNCFDSKLCECLCQTGIKVTASEGFYI